ncbi:site-2 protease family protein [Arsenicibacter rosenii]|uniref:Peptidase M50 domain-containing protein n=1 Tax=Arsenicibacter rosenii TaxID=1750698 RepID=A0A1S2VIS2_9BACT|nr:site-2 protease family protein [Arsenicibacter rosenii]OIN58116.1 hypothetical protein BLX24_16450 [Arsenicibacter rosenii]
MNKRKKILIQLLLGLVAGAGFGYLVGKAGKMFLSDHLDALASPVSGAETLIKFVLVFVAMWAALAAHELGHLLTGLAQGFRFNLYVAGFLGIRRHAETDAVEVYLNKDMQLFGGVAASIPTKRTNNLRRQFARVVIAGPIVSLLGGLLVLGISYYGLIRLTPASTAFMRCLILFGLTFGLVSLLLFLATTLPSRTGVFYTDRARFFRLIRGGRTAEIEQAILETMAHTNSGQSYAELNVSQLHLLLEEPEAFFKSYAHTLLYYYHLDRNELETAFGHIRQAADLLDGQPGLFKNEVLKEVAFAHAYIKGDASLARQIWERIVPSPDKQKTPQTYLIKASIAQASDLSNDARQLAGNGLALLPSPIVKAEHKLVGRLLRQLS